MALSLQQIIDNKLTITTDDLIKPENFQVGVEMQIKLCDLGLLDPTIGGDATTPFGPVLKGDGQVGLNTRNVMFEFCRLANIKYKDRQITTEFAAALLKAQPDTFLPMNLMPDKKDSSNTKLAKACLRYMKSKGYWIARSPKMYNIVYSEGMNEEGTLNPDTFNEWNDRRMVIRIAPGGIPEMLVNDQATTEPGAFYTNRPLNPNGAARIAFGQYKAWVSGLHQGKQAALVQRETIRVHRDINKDGKRNSTDPIDIGKNFGVNQHTTSANKVPDFVGPFSAGCLVGRRFKSHQFFLKTVKSDVRYTMNQAYLFMTAVLAGDDLLKQELSGKTSLDTVAGLESTGTKPRSAGKLPDFLFFDC
jgi:hypothetical protein